ncbi:putative 5-dehydro-2-deoxygluconokinase-like isoform 2 [Capsicum annuum]|nr:putative 5-dehydro-2-deoxygluconokinase-like isoform 2 [Capsicum annuum]
MTSFQLQSPNCPSLSVRSSPSTVQYRMPQTYKLTCDSSFTRLKMSIPSTPQTVVGLPSSLDMFPYLSISLLGHRGYAVAAVGFALGCGMAAVDFLVAVDSFPKPDDKIRSTSFQVQGGGNAGNALTCAARLGLSPRIISKVGDDSQGKAILEEFEADGVDTSFMVVSSELFKLEEPYDVERSSFVESVVNGSAVICLIFGFWISNSIFYITYTSLKRVSVSTILSEDENCLCKNQKKLDAENLKCMLLVKKTRTCIYTPGYPPMIPEDLSKSNLSSALDDVRLVYFDGVLQEAELLSALVVAREAWTGNPSVPDALVSVLLKLPNVKFVIVTLGEDGCMMLERSEAEDLQSEESDVNELFKKMKKSIDTDSTSATCISSDIKQLHAKGIGTVSGRLLLGTAEKIPPSELVDTTGAGDAFIGAVLYALLSSKYTLLGWDGDSPKAMD